jgi:hypothetical protein
LLLELVSLKSELGLGYRALADLVLRGLAGTVMTTNFDLCLPMALGEKHPHFRHVAEINRRPTTSTNLAPSQGLKLSGFTAKPNSIPTETLFMRRKLSIALSSKSCIP